MKSNTTSIWFVLAALLAVTVWFVQKHFQPAPPADNILLAGLRAAEVTSIQITPAGVREISVERTNQAWFLDKPVTYPAQTTAVESFLAALEKLSPGLRLTAAETAHKDADAEFGFENPQYRVDLTAGDHSWHLTIGNKTAPGDGVYVRLVGGPEVYVTDVAWLSTLPREASAWRDAALVGDVGTVDWLVITNGAKAIELRRDATNRLWRMTRPLQTRADSEYITTALQQLRAAKVTRFITDDPKADPAAYGLSPSGLDVWLGHGTNYLGALHAGKDSTEDPSQLYARREGWSSVVATAKETMVPWRGDVNDFRDPHLMTYTGPVTEIEVTGDNNFTLRRQGTNQWAVAGEKFPVDMENLTLFVRLLANLHVTEFVKDVVTAADLQGFGLAPTNSRTIALRSVPGDTNTTVARIIFGATETNKVYVKRGDEDFVYALALPDVKQLPTDAWQFRDRRVLNFSVTNVAGITMHQGDRTLQVLRNGGGEWSVAPGSQGLVDTKGLEETAKQFGTLTTPLWLGRNFSAEDGEKNFGLGTNDLQVTFELKSGEKYALDFGTKLKETALVGATLDGERWAFVFPPVIYPLVEIYLNIPGTP